MAAGHAALSKVLTAEALEAMNRRGDRLRERLNGMAAPHDLPMQVIGVGSIFGIHFHSGPIRNVGRSGSRRGGTGGRRSASSRHCSTSTCWRRANTCPDASSATCRWRPAMPMPTDSARRSRSSWPAAARSSTRRCHQTDEYVQLETRGDDLGGFLDRPQSPPRLGAIAAAESVERPAVMDLHLVRPPWHRCAAGSSTRGRSEPRATR